jgi:hypothetical protein
MKTLDFLLVLCILLNPLQVLVAQEGDEIPLVPYTPDYVFNDGIYLGIDDVKANDPVPLARIVSDRINYDREFFNELILKGHITLYDDAGVRAVVNTPDIWGYALHGRLHIMVGGRFQRIILQGSISQFMASETTYEKAYYGEEDSTDQYHTTQDLYRGFYRDKYYYRNLTAEGRLCLYDFESNTLEAYDPSTLEKILERDSVLFSAYSSLRRREKKKQMVDFIGRYNQDHPLYFPATK